MALKVLITGAAGQIAYSLLYSVAKGDVFGKEQALSLVLLDIPPMMGVLEGVVMELQDCALPLLTEVVATSDEAVAFADIDAAMLVGAMPRREGMERKDLLAANVKIFKSQGAALDKYAKKSVKPMSHGLLSFKVVIVGNPANTNALICKKYAPSIPASNFSALTRLDQNRAQAQLAGKLGVAVEGVYEAVQDDNWLNNEFISSVQQRGAAVIKARKLSSAMSAAKAIGDHMRDWWFGTQSRWVSMGIISDGNTYGIPEGLIFSFPLTVGEDRSWKIVDGLDISDFARENSNLHMNDSASSKWIHHIFIVAKYNIILHLLDEFLPQDIA
ncbi:MDH1 [Bugula neritina]|uniref:Malate dehydrogenase n=1 Tax=Bugula neritina TaxID=10212 RepID=A0A7J7K7F7_BUGNE|nr:MDH1 [Bugula neritina]